MHFAGDEGRRNLRVQRRPSPSAPEAIVSARTYAPPDYDCPFCRIARSDFRGQVIGGAEADALRMPDVTAFVSSHWWPRNEGSVIVIPNAHFESIFDLPAEAAAQIHIVAQRVAVAMTSVYRCEGISTRQHNGPAGGQDVWHYHLHVQPRWRNDRLYERTAERFRAPPNERASRAALLRAALDSSLP